MAEQLLDITFKTETHEGLEEYMQAQKVGFILRKVGKNLTIYETLTKDGDTYTYKFESTFKNHKMVFKMGQPFRDEGPDGRTMMCTFKEEGDKLVAEMVNIKEGDVPCRLERQIQPDGKLQIRNISIPTNTVCTRVYSVFKNNKK